METIKTNYQGLLLTLLAFLAITASAFSQNNQSGKKAADTKVRIIEQKTNDSTTTYYDTTFNDEFTRAMERVEKIMEENNIRMKDLDRHMRRVQVYVNRADSAMNDSAIEMAYKMVLNDKDGKRMHIEVPGMDRDFDFDFDFDIPEVPELPDLPEFGIPEGYMPYHQFGPMRGGEQTLSDVLGDIPMSNVKSYQIKERKDGKRIVIDLDDEAVLGRHENVYIIREHARHHRHERPARPPRPQRPERPEKPAEIEHD